MSAIQWGPLWGFFLEEKRAPLAMTRDRFGRNLETPYLSIQLLNFIVTAMRIVSGREGRRWCAGCRYAPMACDTWFKTHGRSETQLPSEINRNARVAFDGQHTSQPAFLNAT